MTIRGTVQLMLGVGLVLGLASSAHAQATRTWVSGVGDDVNPCSRTAPCKTFAGAISKTATGGFINVLDSGGFGAVTITKSITIDGEGANASILAALVNGVTINGADIVVTLRNLTIYSPLGAPGINGIRVLLADEVHIENVYISGFSGKAIDFNPTGGGEGYVTNVTMTNNAGGGLLINTGRVMVDNVRAESNANGGVLVTGTALAVVRDSYSSGNPVGFGATGGAAAVLTVENSTATHNTNGIFASGGATVRVSDTVIVSNITNGLFNDGASFIISLQGNELTGNPTNGSFSSTVVKQ